MENTTDKSLAASIRETLEDGSYMTITATDKVAYIRIAGADHHLHRSKASQANAATTLRNAGINAHILYRAHHGWHIRATVWA